MGRALDLQSTGRGLMFIEARNKRKLHAANRTIVTINRRPKKTWKNEHI